MVSLLSVMVWGFVATNWEVTPLACGVLAALALIELIHFVEKSNRKLISFLDFVSHQDFSSSGGGTGLGKSFDDLSGAYQIIAKEMRRLNVEKEANSQYLASVVDHINVALLCLSSDGEINLMNRQAKQLFHSPYLYNLKGLEKIDPKLPQIIGSLKNNEHRLLDIDIANENMKLAVHATDFQLLNRDYKLISFQNIRDDLEQQEIDSWQKLVSVLTHEIMNSVTPIISLTGVIKDKMILESGEGPRIGELSQDELHDLQRSVESIESRSKGLHRFVQTYRQLTDIPAPNNSKVAISDIIENLRALMSPELEKRSVALVVNGKMDDLYIDADQQQIEQVLINLIKNAMEALTDRPNPEIRLHIEQTNSTNLVIQIADNGVGIDPEHLEQVFVPFFTTKQHGTGVGLSISRQIAAQNKGILSVISVFGKGSTFSLRFRQAN